LALQVVQRRSKSERIGSLYLFSRTIAEGEPIGIIAPIGSNRRDPLTNRYPIPGDRGREDHADLGLALADSDRQIDLHRDNR
jgi:hypothetical protein